jgi:hypothetical protein
MVCCFNHEPPARYFYNIWQPCYESSIPKLNLVAAYAQPHWALGAETGERLRLHCLARLRLYHTPPSQSVYHFYSHLGRS